MFTHSSLSAQQMRPTFCRRSIMYGSGQGHRHSPDVASSGHASGHAFPAGHCGSSGSHSTVGSQNTAPEPRIAGATTEPAITRTPATRANILPQDLLTSTTSVPPRRTPCLAFLSSSRPNWLVESTLRALGLPPSSAYFHTCTSLVPGESGKGIPMDPR